MDVQRTQTSTMQQAPKRGGFVKYIVFIIILLVAAGGAYAAYSKMQNGYFPWATTEERQAAVLNSTIDAVKKLMVVPDESPVYAEVNDAAMLKSQQAFFQNAENGDRLLIFPTTRQAILYSPARNVIVNAGPIEYTGNEGGAQQQAPAPAPAN